MDCNEFITESTAFYASENKHLQQEILRDEWGFEGLIVTDWGASVDRIPGLKNGTDLEMPSSGTLNQHRIIAAVKNGELDEAVLDERVDNVVNLIMKSKPALEKEHTFDPKAHHAIAQKVAEGSMVLLKNDDGAPFLLRKDRRLQLSAKWLRLHVSRAQVHL